MNLFCVKVDRKISKICCFFYFFVLNWSCFNDFKINIVLLEKVFGSQVGSVCINDNDFVFEGFVQVGEV